MSNTKKDAYTHREGMEILARSSRLGIPAVFVRIFLTVFLFPNKAILAVL